SPLDVRISPFDLQDRVEGAMKTCGPFADPAPARSSAYRGSMSATSYAVTLDSRFAQRLPKLATPWPGANYPHLTLLLLHDQLASELGLDTDFLHTPAGAG